jgi:hypothetical protein
MSDVFKIYSQLTDKDKKIFVSSCYAKQKNLFGCPRLILNKNQKITQSILKKFFNEKNKYRLYDEKFFPLIESDDLACFDSLDLNIIFDISQISFFGYDELYDISSENIRKKFNLSKRHFEKERFILSNSNHFGDTNTICEKIIFEKLKSLWSYKWSNPESYLGPHDKFDINIIDD